MRKTQRKRRLKAKHKKQWDKARPLYIKERNDLIEKRKEIWLAWIEYMLGSNITVH